MDCHRLPLRANCFHMNRGYPGLFLAGQTTLPGYGVGAAMMSGVFAAQACSGGIE